MNKQLAVFVILAIIALPIAAIADGDGVYISGDVGQSHFSGVAGQSETLTNNLGSLGTPATGVYRDNDTGFRLGVGYQFDPYWGIEASYVDLGQADINITTTTPNLSSDTKLKAHGWVLAGTGTIPISSTWNVFVRLGAVDAHVEREVNSSGFEIPTIASNSSSTDWKATYGAGVSWSFAPNWSARLGWDQYRHLGNSGTGEHNVNLTSIGIAYLFND
ncbi:MAG: outer membrane protein [Gammaproteobacteria bacterium]